MILAIGCDHAGFSLKKEIVDWLEAAGHEVRDFGCHSTDSCDYADYAVPVAKAIANGECARGILICGTGIGMAIAANRFHGVRAANCGDTFSARATREHNDSNILTLGERVVGPGLALDILKTWMETEFSGNERHARRIQKITELEKRYERKP
jgi:ribose 5-phosphate isomerase B